MWQEFERENYFKYQNLSLGSALICAAASTPRLSDWLYYRWWQIFSVTRSGEDKAICCGTYNSLSVEDTSPYKVEKPKFRKDAVMSEYLDIFGKDIKSMQGKVLLETDRTVVPSVMPPIHIPFLLKEKLKNILDLLTQKKVISPFQEPKDWFPSMIAAK